MDDAGLLHMRAKGKHTCLACKRHAALTRSHMKQVFQIVGRQVEGWYVGRFGTLHVDGTWTPCYSHEKAVTLWQYSSWKKSRNLAWIIRCADGEASEFSRKKDVICELGKIQFIVFVVLFAFVFFPTTTTRKIRALSRLYSADVATTKNCKSSLIIFKSTALNGDPNLRDLYQDITYQHRIHKGCNTVLLQGISSHARVRTHILPSNILYPKLSIRQHLKVTIRSADHSLVRIEPYYVRLWVTHGFTRQNHIVT